MSNSKLLIETADAIDLSDLRLLDQIFRQDPQIRNGPAPGIGGWLHYAAYEGKREVVEHLISEGFEINEKDTWDGVTALNSAALGGHYDTVKYLLDRGAAIDTSTSARNPLFAAISGSIQVNATHSPPTGEAPQIVRLLLEHGLDSKVRYNSKTMTNMDAVAFAMMMGARDLAHVIALWNAGGEEDVAKAAMDEGWRIANENTVPVPPGEQYAPS